MNIDISTDNQYNQRLTTYSFYQIKELYDKSKLNLNPEYQREIVWTKEKMMLLIESIIHGYYYPPIIINLSNAMYTCIDGKQRITSVLKFLTNEIYYNSEDNEIYFNDLNEQNKEYANWKRLLKKSKFKNEHYLAGRLGGTISIIKIFESRFWRFWAKKRICPKI
jgi:uncharacterized protein with ParB-like and HNH nuclease domain